MTWLIYRAGNISSSPCALRSFAPVQITYIGDGTCAARRGCHRFTPPKPTDRSSGFRLDQDVMYIFYVVVVGVWSVERLVCCSMNEKKVLHLQVLCCFVAVVLGWLHRFCTWEVFDLLSLRTGAPGGLDVWTNKFCSFPLFSILHVPATCFYNISSWVCLPIFSLSFAAVFFVRCGCRTPPLFFCTSSLLYHAAPRCLPAAIFCCCLWAATFAYRHRTRLPRADALPPAPIPPTRSTCPPLLPCCCLPLRHARSARFLYRPPACRYTLRRCAAMVWDGGSSFTTDVLLPLPAADFCVIVASFLPFYQLLLCTLPLLVFFLPVPVVLRLYLYLLPFTRHFISPHLPLTGHYITDLFSAPYIHCHTYVVRLFCLVTIPYIYLASRSVHRSVQLIFYPIFLYIFACAYTFVKKASGRRMTAKNSEWQWTSHRYLLPGCGCPCPVISSAVMAGEWCRWSAGRDGVGHLPHLPWAGFLPFNERHKVAG